MTTHKIRLIMTECDSNHNKFWFADVDGCKVTRRWGRVGNKAQSRDYTYYSHSEAVREIEAVANKKRRKGYQDVDLLTEGESQVGRKALGAIAKKQIKTNGDRLLSDLVDFLVKVNVHRITANTSITYSEGQLSTALGVITPRAIKQARDYLDQIASLVRKGDFGYTFQRVVESYLMIVPTKVGRKLRPREVLGTLDKVEEQSQILDSMEAVGGSVEVETDEEVFAVELSEADGGTVRDIQKLVEKTSSRGHRSYGMKVKRVYKVKIENDDYEGGSNEWMLWHGTKASNLLSILRKGLVIVPRGASHTTGRMYGDGLYFSDQSTKALNYATTFWGGRDEGRYFMLICRVAMGKAYTPDRYGCRKPPRGYDSVYAKGGQSGVINNEMVVYRESQARIEYIVEFSK